LFLPSDRTANTELDRRMQVPLLDLKAQYRALESDVQAAIREVCETQQFVMGPRIVELERRIAEYSQARFGIGVSSGTDALLVALMALDIGPGDAVVTTPYTFFATAGVIARLGARPIFCDIDERTFNLSPEAVAAFLERRCERDGDALIDRGTGGRVRAIMPVHLYGQVADIDGFRALAREHRLEIVEDAAQAIGAETADGRRAGSLGEIGCFSFFPTKNLGAFGDAGMCVTNDPALAEKLEILRIHGGRPKYYHAVIGGNFRLDEIQAAVLLVKLAYLDQWTAARQQNAAHYRELFEAAGLNDRVGLPEVRPGRHIFNQFVVRVPDRDRLRAYLTEQRIGTEIYYPVSLHEQQCFAYLGYAPGDLPNASRAAAETLALPIYPELTAAQREHVVGRIAAFFGS
jgi:dTDP-4-amino-4,6-dideoxygalactose transaminase